MANAEDMKFHLAASLILVPVTEAELAAAFTEWDRRFREEPDRFQSEASRLLKETPETYGAACAPYLIQILGELRDNIGPLLESPPAFLRSYRDE